MKDVQANLMSRGLDTVFSPPSFVAVNTPSAFDAALAVYRAKAKQYDQNITEAQVSKAFGE